jgi:hypothetical protein
MAQIFPRWSNEAPRYILLGSVVGLGALVFAVYYWASPWHTDVGYRPKQPIPYSHRLHAGDLGMDCRYCHMFVERGPHAGVPPTQVCMNCHRQIKKDAPALAALRESWDKGTPIPWKRIHKVPDFAYFDHSAHVGVGVGANRAAIGCETCHGRIDTMGSPLAAKDQNFPAQDDGNGVIQNQPLSMAWCIECHNDPTSKLRPVDAVTKMGWFPPMGWRDQAEKIAATLHPPGSLSRAHMLRADGTPVTVASAGCSGCHR